MKKYLIIFIVVFLALDAVLLVGFLGRKSTTPTTTTPNQTTSGLTQRSPTPAGTNIQTSANALPIATNHPFVTSVIVEYTFASAIRTLAPGNLTLKVGKVQELPRIIIDQDTKFFKLTDGQIYPASYSDLQKNQNVKVNALYNFKSGHWRADKITILAPSNTTPSNQ